MYLRILKKDLRRKKTMNMILLLFIILAATFIASSANNMLTVATALDDYFEMAQMPDYFVSIADPDEEKLGQIEAFVRENGYGCRFLNVIQMDPKLVSVDGELFCYGNTLCVSAVGGNKVFDSDGREVVSVPDGEIYVTAEIFASDENDFHEGSVITMEAGGEVREFALKGYVKDAGFGSSMIGMTRFLVSENDYAWFEASDERVMTCILIDTKDPDFLDRFNQLEMQLIMNVDYATMKMMYIMDMLIAAVVLVVSICLILISMVILRFTIHFTMEEEFREIGVMKAIGIPNQKIRGLYIVKYCAISAVGAAVGLVLSIPFGRLLIESASRNIIISNQNPFFLNLVCAVGTAAVVVLFSYFCTRKIKRISPIDAVRNGERGERYVGKGLIHLSRSRLSPVPFLAVNDIFSDLKRYASMILIFTLGFLLIVLPVNTINTLRSDNLIYWFNMADCDLVVSREMLLTQGKNEALIEESLREIRETLGEHDIQAEVFQEIMFRFRVSHAGHDTSSLAFQGAGEVTAERYSYLEGTPPQNRDEVAISHIVADRIDASIGDRVEINIGPEVRSYLVTAIIQSMNNMGEGIRFYQEEDLDYDYAAGSFGIQIRCTNDADGRLLEEGKALLEEFYPEDSVYTAGEYISHMIGDVASRLQGVKQMILGIVLCINLLMTILMVRSFIAREKKEIVILKAIGFSDFSLLLWQTLRIGMVLLLSIFLGTLLATPLAKLIIQPIFRMMGAYDIKFEIIPMEVYVLYPTAVLAVTILAGVLGALQITKISTKEASDIG
ncbi:MAG: ABC transporter permease [Candidatus Gastranaerophilales bacterium]|nr:ABC transporter permease [Candidatus Gastranaerophilales bacterium]